MHYDRLGEPIFRERDVRACSAWPGRAPKATPTVPAELVNYAARIPSGQAGTRPGPGLIVVRVRAGWCPSPIARCSTGGSPSTTVALPRPVAPALRSRSVTTRRWCDLGAYALLPALVNAHVHLELSSLRGQVPRAERFTDWVPAMLQRRMAAAPDRDAIVGAVETAIAEMRASGTGIVGDISNSLVTVEPLRRSALDGVVFHEVLRFAADGADDVLDGALRAQETHGATGRFPVSLAPHAPYSVSPRLFQGIRAAQARTPFLPSSVHLAESPGGSRVARDRRGAWRGLLERFGALGPDVDAAGLFAVDVSRSDARARPASAGRARRGMQRRRPRGVAGARDDRGVLPQEQPLRGRRRPARRRGSTGPGWRWRWAPTAWPATTT